MLCLDPQNITNVLAAILSEQQILFISQEAQRVRCVIDTLLALLYPFSWQHLCVPWLIPSHSTFLEIGVPFIVGVPQIKRK
eukprot:UN30481